MTLHEKLLEMQKRVDSVIKDGKNSSDKYDFASDENVLGIFRPMLDEFGLLLIPKVERTALHEGTTRSGTARFMTEVWFTMLCAHQEGRSRRGPAHQGGRDGPAGDRRGPGERGILPASYSPDAPGAVRGR